MLVRTRVPEERTRRGVQKPWPSQLAATDYRDDKHTTSLARTVGPLLSTFTKTIRRSRQLCSTA